MKSAAFASVAAVLLALAVPAVGADTLGDLIGKAGLEPLKSDTKIIDFKLDDLQGDSVRLSSFGGRVVLLNFWATWCEPCRDEMPSLESLYNLYKDKGLVVVGVDLDESAASVQSFVSQHGITFPILLDRSGSVGLRYGARGIPTSYLIDKDGDVTSGTVGGREWTTPETRALIDALVGE